MLAELDSWMTFHCVRVAVIMNLHRHASSPRQREQFGVSFCLLWKPKHNHIMWPMSTLNSKNDKNDGNKGRKTPAFQDNWSKACSVSSTRTIQPHVSLIYRQNPPGRWYDLAFDTGHMTGGLYHLSVYRACQCFTHFNVCRRTRCTWMSTQP